MILPPFHIPTSKSISWALNEPTRQLRKTGAGTLVWTGNNPGNSLFKAAQGVVDCTAGGSFAAIGNNVGVQIAQNPNAQNSGRFQLVSGGPQLGGKHMAVEHTPGSDIALFHFVDWGGTENGDMTFDVNGTPEPFGTATFPIGGRTGRIHKPGGIAYAYSESP